LARIEETKLPGVGVRYEFETEDGRRVGVIHHRTGRRELFVCPASDPDTTSMVLNLSEGEAHELVDVLGGSQVVESLAHVQQHIEGLAIDWLPVEEGSAYAGRSIGDARIRTRTGVSVVAVVRDEDPFPAPGPEFRIEGDDTLVVVGTPDGIEKVTEILRTG
jgi:TrkA domain protein